MCMARWLQVQRCFGAHVHQEVEDAEVGQEAVLLLIYLVVFLLWNRWSKGCDAEELGGARRTLVDVKDAEATLYEGFVEIDEVFPLTFVDRTEVVLEVFEEWGVVITGLEGKPVLVLPVELMAQLDVAHETFAPIGEVALVDRDGQGETTVRGVDIASVAECLLLEVLVDLNSNWFAALESSEPTDWG